VYCYAVLNASTGSFLLAIFAGINPAITVSNTLIIIRIIAPAVGSLDKLLIPVNSLIMILAGILIIIVTYLPLISLSIKLIFVNIVILHKIETFFRFDEYLKFMI
jgi:hypothetical protein